MARYKKKVRERDGNRCQKCGTRHNLTCHHIMPKMTHPELIDKLDNLITLCDSCHRNYHYVFLEDDNNKTNEETFKEWFFNYWVDIEVKYGD